MTRVIFKFLMISFLSLGLLATVPIVSVASEGAFVQLRAGEHKDFTRLVFDWPQKPASYTTNLAENILTISFDAVATVDTAKINKRPPELIVSVATKPNSGKTEIRVVLAPGMGIRSFLNENSVVFDVQPSKQTASNEAPPTAKKPEANPVEIATNKIAPVTADVKKAKLAEPPEKIVSATVRSKKDAPQTVVPIKKEIPAGTKSLPARDMRTIAQATEIKPIVEPKSKMATSTEIVEVDLPRFSGHPDLTKEVSDAKDQTCLCGRI